MPRHSILIAAFNRFDYLFSTVMSCLASNDPDFELLINDDASTTSETDYFYDRLASLDSRISIYRNASNEGVGTRIQELHTYAQGKYIHVIGSDDLMHPARMPMVVRDLDPLISPHVIWCSQAVYLDQAFRRLGTSESRYTSSYLKALLFLQPGILHPTVSYYHPDISKHVPYRSGMKAAVDYMFYVDNYFACPIFFRKMPLTYLVHSSTGITRSSDMRSVQLAMHDYAMFRLWSYYIPCQLSHISILRSLLVADEYPSVDVSRLNSNDYLGLIHLVKTLQHAVHTSNCSVPGFNANSRDLVLGHQFMQSFDSIIFSINERISRCAKSTS